MWEIRRRLRNDLIKNILVGERLFILSSFLTLTLFEFWTPICKRVNFPNFQKARMQVTGRLQTSNGVLMVACDLRNPSDLHCQLNVGLIVTDWGFADFYAVILTRSWVSNPNLDPDTGQWWVFAVINVRADNLSQKQFLPLPTNSERNQTSPQNWFKSKTGLSGERLFILFSFLTLTLY